MRIGQTAGKDRHVFLAALAFICILSGTSVAAAPLSDNLTGEYCNGTRDGEAYTYCAPGDWEKRTDDWLILEPKRLLQHEVSCRFVSVRERLVPVKVLPDVAIGASKAEIVAKCEELVCRWRARLTITMFRGILEVK